MRIYINIHRPDEAFDLKSEYILVSVMVNLLIKKFIYEQVKWWLRGKTLYRISVRTHIF